MKGINVLVTFKVGPAIFSNSLLRWTYLHQVSSSPSLVCWYPHISKCRSQEITRHSHMARTNSVLCHFPQNVVAPVSNNLWAYISEMMDIIVLWRCPWWQATNIYLSGLYPEVHNTKTLIGKQKKVKMSSHFKAN